MQSNDNEKNRGTHGDSSFMLDGMPSSSENPPALAVGSVNVNEVRWGQIGSRELAEDERFYREVGEIDLDGVILDAVKQAVKERKDKG